MRTRASLPVARPLFRSWLLATSLLPILLLSSGLNAQSTKRLAPDPGNLEGSGSSPYIAAYGAGRAQQVILGNAICSFSAIITELAMRADGASMTTLASRKLSSLKLSLGYTSKSPSAMSRSFSNNRTGSQTLLFKGNYSLPPQNSKTRPFNIRWKFAKPFLFLRSKGNLLIEFEIPGKAAGNKYMLDAHQQNTSSGYSYNYGKAGKFSGTEVYKLACTNNADLKPGGKAVVAIYPLTKRYPALSFWGFSRQAWGPVKLPFDMRIFDAKGNYLNVSPDLVYPLVLTAVGSSYAGVYGISIPADNAFMGKSIFTQSVFVDPKANLAGFVMTEGLAMTLLQNRPPAQLLGHYDSTMPSGFFSKAGEGIVFEFTGTFF